MPRKAPEPTRPGPPRRRPNAAARGREHLTAAEVEDLAKAAAGIGRHGSRDAPMIRLAYRHGLRISDLVTLRRDQIDLDAGLLHVRRAKRGLPATHPLGAVELRGLGKPLKTYPQGPYAFTSERKGPLTDSAVRKIVARAGISAQIPFPVHHHMLRHACGFKLANDGQDTRAIQAYLGHRNIQHMCATRTWPRIGSRRSGGLSAPRSGPPRREDWRDTRVRKTGPPVQVS